MIRLSEVSKEYAGVLGRLAGERVRALEALTLHVPPGAALGVVGPNGAGKSTLLRLLLGYLRPSAGKITIDGLPPRQYVEQWGIGYVPERVEIPPRWTVRATLRTYAALGEVERPHERIDEEMERLGLVRLADQRVSALSKGNLQRLAIAQALLGERRLLILDEPTDGLDPEWTVRVREILFRWRAADPARVLLFASHNLDEVERIANRVVVLQAGRLREIIDLRAPIASALPPYRLALAAPPIEVTTQVAGLFPGALSLDDGAGEAGATALFRVTAPDLPELNRRLARLIEAGTMVQALSPERPSLEQQVLRVEG